MNGFGPVRFAIFDKVVLARQIGCRREIKLPEHVAHVAYS